MSTYRLEELIGRGGMGEVYAARQILPNNGGQTRVACKTIALDDRGRASYVELFMKEARLNLAISQDHRGIVTAYDCIADAHGRCHLVMEFIEGSTLEDIFAVFGHPAGPATPAGALYGLSGRVVWDLLRLTADELLDALAYIHENGVIHSDISPCNVMVSRAGAIKIADFGLARIADPAADPSSSHALRFRGKWPYAAPEALRREPVDSRADLFAFAATMYELITGQTVYDPAQGLDAVAQALESWQPPALPDGVPLDLRALVAGLLCKDPSERRPQSAEQARAMLAPFARNAARTIMGQLAGQIFERAEESRQRHPPASPPRMLEVRQCIDTDADSTPSSRTYSCERQRTESATRPARRRRQHRRRRRSERRRTLAAIAAILAVAVLGWFGKRDHRAKPAATVATTPERTDALEVLDASDALDALDESDALDARDALDANEPLDASAAASVSRPRPPTRPRSAPTANSRPAPRPAAARSSLLSTCTRGGRCYTQRPPPERVPSPYRDATPDNPNRGTVRK